MTDNPKPKAALPDALIELGSFAWPRSETRQTLGHLFEKIKGGFGTRSDTGVVDEQNLKRVSDDALASRASELLAEHQSTLLDTAYLDWSNNGDGRPFRRALIMPPTSENLLNDWATKHGIDILKPNDELAGLPKNSCIVIPKLEGFFGRDYKQLDRLFDLFDKLAQRDAKVLVGCNSWAWLFLKQFDDAHLLFEDVKTIPAFDAEALAAILHRALSDAGNDKTITSISSGDPILARDSDGDLEDPYLQDLAGCSLGHPNVALEMFFRGIAEIDDEEPNTPAEKIWVGLPKPCSLPAFGAEPLLFALQALMIHGSRPINELNAMLPHRVPNGTWTELVRAGFVEIEDGTARCAIRSYPDIRSELGAAGFNLDKL